MHHAIIYSISTFIIILSLSACVSIPSEAPELSVELGKRISAIEDSNITLLNRFFDQLNSTFYRGIYLSEIKNQTFTENWVKQFIHASG